MEPHETSAETLDGSHHRGVLGLVALAITFTLSPPVLVPVLLWIVLGWVGAPAVETAALVGACTVLIGVLPVSFLLWMVRSGRSRTLNLEDRRHRSRALGVSIAGGLIFMTVILAMSVTERVLILGMVVAYLLTIGMLTAINTYWRISLHAASAGAFASVIAFVATRYADPVGLSVAASTLTVMAAALIALVTWSRWHLRAHTPGQLLVGTVVGLIVPYAVLTVLTSIFMGGAGS
jgi:hypothetical protein